MRNQKRAFEIFDLFESGKTLAEISEITGLKIKNLRPYKNAMQGKKEPKGSNYYIKCYSDWYLEQPVKVNKEPKFKVGDLVDFIGTYHKPFTAKIYKTVKIPGNRTGYLLENQIGYFTENNLKLVEKAKPEPVTTKTTNTGVNFIKWVDPEIENVKKDIEELKKAPETDRELLNFLQSKLPAIEADLHILAERQTNDFNAYQSEIRGLKDNFETFKKAYEEKQEIDELLDVSFKSQYILSGEKQFVRNLEKKLTAITSALSSDFNKKAETDNKCFSLIDEGFNKIETKIAEVEFRSITDFKSLHGKIETLAETIRVNEFKINHNIDSQNRANLTFTERINNVVETVKKLGKVENNSVDLNTRNIGKLFEMVHELQNTVINMENFNSTINKTFQTLFDDGIKVLKLHNDLQEQNQFLKERVEKLEKNQKTLEILDGVDLDIYEPIKGIMFSKKEMFKEFSRYNTGIFKSKINFSIFENILNSLTRYRKKDLKG